MLKTEAIVNLLKLKTLPDLAKLYNPDMEVQVNVAKDKGEAVEGDYKGKRWVGYSDGATTWKPFRIPRNANTDPSYTDTNITFDIAEHAEGVGMTGWNWKLRLSYWVAFDFDAMCGHSESHTKKLSAEELAALQQAVTNVPWVTLRKSTSGRGLHLYVFLSPVPTANHTEHAALARAILSMLSAITGYNFSSKVDICGGNMWVWHRKMVGTDGLKLLKEGVPLTDVPQNWKEHTDVVAQKSRKSAPGFVTKDNEDPFDALTRQYTHTPLDNEHKKLIDFLAINKYYWAWHPDHHMLVSHTAGLKDAHTALGMKGMFETIATGKDRGDHNCFLFPLRGGAWSVRRYGIGTAESSEKATWQKDQKGFSYCYLNKQLDLKTACLFHGGIEHEKGGWVFREAEVIQTVLLKLGCAINLPPFILLRPGRIIPHKENGKTIVHIEHQTTDPVDKMEGWNNEKKLWRRVFYLSLPEEVEQESTEDYDNFVRHVVTEDNVDAGWRASIGDGWRNEPYVNIRLLMKGSESSPKDIDLVLSQAVKRGWKLVNKPFQSEYPGDRQWNMGNAKLKVVPTLNTDNLSFPTWQAILDHCGAGLTEAIQHNDWAKENNITNGAMYLKLWLTSLIKQPTKALPYLCFWGDQDNGKSSYHEAITEILIENGHVRAEAALLSQGNFNGELLGKILAIVEEVDLRKNQAAANKMKDWVTGSEISIHMKMQTPFNARNYLHWIQCSNKWQYCPITVGDTRITMIHVGPLKEKIGRDELRLRLKKEAPDFLASVLATEIPYNNDRLAIPIIATRDKEDAIEASMDSLQVFFKNNCYYVPGQTLKVAECFARFQEDLPGEEIPQWSKQKMSANLPSGFVKGKDSLGNMCYGNMSFDKNATPGAELFCAHNGYLRARS